MLLHHAMLPHHALVHPMSSSHTRLHLPAVHLAAIHVVVLGCDIDGHRRRQRNRRCNKQRAGFQLFHVFLHGVGWF